MNNCPECGNDLDFGICMCFEYIEGYEDKPNIYNDDDQAVSTNYYEIVNDTVWISVFNSNNYHVGTIRADAKYVNKISKYKWGITSGYAVSTDGKDIRLHRLIMDCPDDMIVDHTNHDTLDNRECNLRICTHQQNMWNKKKSPNNTSGYTGVFWNPRDKRWVARITVNYKHIHLGNHKDIDDAIAARKSAEAKYFGEFAYKPGL